MDVGPYKVWNWDEIPAWKTEISEAWQAHWRSCHKCKSFLNQRAQDREDEIKEVANPNCRVGRRLWAKHYDAFLK